MQRVTLCMLWVKMIHIFFSNSGFGNDRPQAATLFFAMCILCICSAFPSSSPPAIFDGDSVVTIPFCTKKKMHIVHIGYAHTAWPVSFVCRSFVHSFMLLFCLFGIHVLSLFLSHSRLPHTKCNPVNVQLLRRLCKCTRCTGENLVASTQPEPMCAAHAIASRESSKSFFFFVTLAKGILPWNDGHFEHIEWCVCACGISVFRFGPAHRSHHHCCWQLLYSGFFGTEWNTREYIYMLRYCTCIRLYGPGAQFHIAHCTTAHAIRTTCFTFTHTKRNTLETIYEAQARQTPNIKT